MIRNYISGANGFIGRHLANKLLKNGNCSIRSVPHNEIHNSFITVGRYYFLSTYGNMAYHNDFHEMVEANVENIILSIFGFHGWFCYMSSSSVLLPVQTPYSRTKRAAEEILQALPELKSCIVRPFSVTGVGEQREHLIPTLIRSCLEGEEMPFDPNPVHDFIDVEDVVDGLILLADRQVQGVFEFGSGIPHTNQEIRELVEHFCQRKANVREVSGLREYDNEGWFCKKPQFKPSKPIAKSIEEMVEAYKREHC